MFHSDGAPGGNAGHDPMLAETMKSALKLGATRSAQATPIIFVPLVRRVDLLTVAAVLGFFAGLAIGRLL